MLRLIHAQTVSGPIVVDDIDDGLPNKEVHRLAGDPKAYARDGYANKPKQACYIPYSKTSSGTTLSGWIDIHETSRVILSHGKGKIAKLAKAGLITVTTFAATDVVAPVLSVADLGTPSTGDLTLTGTGFVSLAPDISAVILTGAVSFTLTSTQIVTGGGTFTDTSIFIPAAMIPGATTVSTSAKVRADNQLSSAVALS